MNELRMIKLDELTAELVYSVLASYGCLRPMELPEEAANIVRNILYALGYLGPDDMPEPPEPPDIMEETYDESEF